MKRYVQSGRSEEARAPGIGSWAARRQRPRPIESRRPLPVDYNGGPLLPQPHLYVIYWGKSRNFAADFVAGMNDFIQAWGDTSYTAIMQQYLAGYPDVTGQAIADGAVLPAFSPDTDTWQDTSKPPTFVGGGLSAIAKIGREACQFAEQSGGPDPNGIYLVMTSNFPRRANYCAWHSSWSCDSDPLTNFALAYLPNINKVPGCYIGPRSTIAGITNPYSYGVRSNANSAAHELSEVVTDPFNSGWYDSHNNEIADKCVGKFVTPVNLNDAYTWQLQELWSNAEMGCIQGE